MSIVRAALLASPITALGALLLFGAVHALWIVPIWDRLFGGLPFVLVGAVAVAWFYGRLRVADRLPEGAVAAGIAFGVGAWMALLPATALMLVFRATGFHAAHDDWETAFEVATAAATGAAIGWALLRDRRSAIASEAGTAALLLVQAGPVPLLNGPRPMGLFLLLAGIYAACGIIQGVATTFVVHIGRSRTVG